MIGILGLFDQADVYLADCDICEGHLAFTCVCGCRLDEYRQPAPFKMKCNACKREVIVTEEDAEKFDQMWGLT
jgi:hypothetical protein